jgi:3-hydroxyacyl-[acyl-carrier-protein] dehydratase
MVVFLPHRAPFVLVDAIVEHVPGQRASGRRMVSTSDPLLRDGDQLIEVLLIEVMAQCAGIASADDQGTSGMLVAVDSFRVHAPVEAGDSLLVEARVVKRMGAVAKARATIRVDDELRADGELVLRLEKAMGEAS